MFSVVIAAATLAFAAAPDSGAQTSTPLREIVYRFSFERKVESSVEQFGAPDVNVGLGGGLSGKMTVDVMQVDDSGTMRLNVTTDFLNAVNAPKPLKCDVVIRSDGSMRIVSGDEPDDITATLLPYFGTAFFADHPLQEGSTWKVLSPAGDSGQLSTTFNVSNVSADSATITSTGKMSGTSSPGTLSVETKLVYKATLLVPVSLDILITRSATSMSGGTTTPRTATTHYHFDRLSDSRDPAK